MEKEFNLKKTRTYSLDATHIFSVFNGYIKYKILIFFVSLSPYAVNRLSDQHCKTSLKNLSAEEKETLLED